MYICGTYSNRQPHTRFHLDRIYYLCHTVPPYMRLHSLADRPPSPSWCAELLDDGVMTGFDPHASPLDYMTTWLDLYPWLVGPLPLVGRTS